MELSLEKLYVDTGVLIKIQVAGMYEKSIQLYQQGAISPLFLGGRGSGVWVLPVTWLKDNVKPFHSDFMILFYLPN